MKELSGIIVPSTIIALVMFSVIFGFIQRQNADASVGWGNEYNARVIDSTTASGTALTVYKTGVGSIGSIVIASSSAAVATYPLVTVYDASSTMATSSARKIAVFNGTPATGTYTFDAVVTNGVAVEVPVGFNGAYTITWR